VSRILTETLSKSATKLTETYTYHDRILEALAGHGLVPRSGTPPARLREAVRDLYVYEIRKLRRSLLAGRIAKQNYASEVIELRKRYLLLSVPLTLWVTGGTKTLP
jgi:hypothetical protein